MDENDDRSSLLEFTDRINLKAANESHTYGDIASSDPRLQQHQTVGEPIHITDGSFINESHYHDKADSDSDEDGPPRPKYGKKTRGRVKVRMQFINDKLRRYTTFSKRKTGIMKKAYELSTLTGTQVMLLVASETGHVYTFATKKLQPMITSESGKALIQTCLNSPESGVMTQAELEKDRRMNPNGFEETELCCAAAMDEEEGTDSGEVQDLLATREDVSDSQGDPTHSVPTSGISQGPQTSTNSNTFNIHTIIPPTSNSDGTVGKVTNLSMQIPHSTSFSNVSVSSLPQPQSSMFSSDGSDTSDQVLSRQRLPMLNFGPTSDRQLQRQQEEQQQEIERLTQLNQEHQQELQNRLQQLQTPQAQVVQRLPTQPNAQMNGQQQFVIPKQALLAVGGSAQPNNTVLYPSTQNQTFVYATTPTISNQLTDGVALVNIVTSQPQNYPTAQMGAISSPAQPQLITIPISQLANNPVMLQQMISNQQELGGKT